MGSALKSATVAFLVAGEGAEQSEIEQPWQAVIEEGGRPVLVSPAKDKVQLFEHLDRGETQQVNVQVGQAQRRDYRGPRPARRGGQSRPAADDSGGRGVRAATSSTRASRWQRSATRRGP